MAFGLATLVGLLLCPPQPSSGCAAPHGRPMAGPGGAFAQVAQAQPGREPAAKKRQWLSNEPVSDAEKRRFLVGIEGVVMQAAPLRPAVVRLDPRFVGRTVALGGLGVFGRFRPVPLLAFDLAVRSGSLRYGDRDDDTVVAEDHVLAEAGVLLFVARSEVAQFAFDGGVGGVFNRVEYQPAVGPSGRQIFGSALVRVGGDVEFVLKRVAIVLSLRGYGVITDRGRVDNKGALMDRASAQARRAPVPTLQTWLIGSAGVGYRF